MISILDEENNPMTWEQVKQRFEVVQLGKSSVCSDCPPADYPTDKTRCAKCPRAEINTSQEEPKG